MRRIAVTLTTAAIAGITASALAACSSSTSSTPATAGSGSGTTASASTSASASLSGSITVFAAASLKEAFTTIGKQFEAAHPGVKVTFSFGASSTLATQIINGAPADVFASAAPKNMQQIVTAGDASSPVDFVKNVMEVAVPPSNPAHVASVNDLAKSSVKVALCQPQVPCGATAAKVFGNAKITVRPVTLQPDVKSVLTQVELGNVDAGVVYVTDVNAAKAKVKGIPIPDGVNASTEYPIAPVSKSGNMSLAQAFVAYVLSPAGQAVLTTDKFEKP
ncbi:MAG TPA: molybdate ABC transporter substrate-binding protein [Streptosporangiaceae bacterium]